MEVAAKQISRLEQMPEERKRETIAHGLCKIAENITSFLAQVQNIPDSAPRASTILLQIAAEEAGKGFLLVDYLRPYQGISAERRARHLRCFYSHLARGMYVKYYQTRPDAFAEVEFIIDDYRASHYLDGPNDIDWIFRNEIEEERERELYVDLVSDEEGLRWHSPTDLWERRARFPSLPASAPPICDLFLGMQEAGLLGTGALAILTTTWRDVSISSTTRWIDYLPVNQDLLYKCRHRNLLTSRATDALLAQIEDEFLYPLCGLDLGRRSVSSDELQEQRARHLDFLNREYL